MVSLFWYLTEIRLLGFDLKQRNVKLGLTNGGLWKLILKLQSYEIPSNDKKTHV